MEKYFEGIGRRKTSTARVRIYKGDKASTINGVP
ncbi:TPA: 30S ribosomal protein S9, partial [Patescibacteria group bacterium]|nr:30S ribosomal protein S9 [Patescibacteria group bacterium]